MTTPTSSETPATGPAPDLEVIDELEQAVDDAGPAITVGNETPPAGGGFSARLAGWFTLARLRRALSALWPPTLGIVGFLLLWAVVASRVNTQIGQLPGPGQVWDAAVGLYDAWRETRAAEAAFLAQQEADNAVRIANGEPPVDFPFNGPVTIVDQIWTSLRTVTFGFLIGTVIAVPLGLAAGLSTTFGKAINPLVQVFRPVSPLAWLPIVQLVIAAAITSNDPTFEKAFLISAIVVTLNSLWPTLINTQIGASSVDKDLLNVAEVLRLGWFTRLRKIVLPSAMPYIFTGMRLSLGVGWMVLIAAEMLAQNPGLGKFIWDEFQSGSSQSTSRIMAAVILIGIIGFLLDRVMAILEGFVSRNRVAA
ncbi:MAG: ABC transporter permease [Actinomycetota bacterium]